MTTLNSSVKYEVLSGEYLSDRTVSAMILLYSFLKDFQMTPPMGYYRKVVEGQSVSEHELHDTIVLYHICHLPYLRPRLLSRMSIEAGEELVAAIEVGKVQLPRGARSISNWQRALENRKHQLK